MTKDDLHSINQRIKFQEKRYKSLTREHDQLKTSGSVDLDVYVLLNALTLEVAKHRSTLEELKGALELITVLQSQLSI